MTPFVLDTNLYVRAFRSAEARAALEAFVQPRLPWCWLSAVVLFELQAGARGAGRRNDVDAYVARGFGRRRRICTPTTAAWSAAGGILRELVARHRLDGASLTPSFALDVVLAASCRQHGLTLITENVRDFSRIATVLPFAFAPPWPG